VCAVCGEIAARIIGLDALDQDAIDRGLIGLDGTSSLRRLGANGILATSLAPRRRADRDGCTTDITSLNQLTLDDDVR